MTRVFQLKIKIQTLLTAMTLLAILLAVLLAARPYAIPILFTVVFVSHVLSILMPIPILVASITLGRQDGNRLVVSESLIVRSLLYFWLVSFVVVCVFWVGISIYFFIV
jgi:hypothetical protein